MFLKSILTEILNIDNANEYNYLSKVLSNIFLLFSFHLQHFESFFEDIDP